MNLMRLKSINLEKGQNDQKTYARKCYQNLKINVWKCSPHNKEFIGKNSFKTKLRWGRNQLFKLGNQNQRNT